MEERDNFIFSSDAGGSSWDRSGGLGTEISESSSPDRDSGKSASDKFYAAFESEFEVPVLLTETIRHFIGEDIEDLVRIKNVFSEQFTYDGRDEKLQSLLDKFLDSDGFLKLRFEELGSIIERIRKSHKLMLDE